MVVEETRLAADIEAMTDWYTEELFEPLSELGETIRFPFSRFVVDPDRDDDDDLESWPAGKRP